MRGESVQNSMYLYNSNYTYILLIYNIAMQIKNKNLKYRRNSRRSVYKQKM